MTKSSRHAVSFIAVCDSMCPSLLSLEDDEGSKITHVEEESACRPQLETLASCVLHRIKSYTSIDPR